jgi:hypothetical protein
MMSIDDLAKYQQVFSAGLSLAINKPSGNCFQPQQNIAPVWKINSPSIVQRYPAINLLLNTWFESSPTFDVSLLPLLT